MENIYESNRTLGEYLLFHFGSREEQFPWAEGPLDALDFPRRTVEELIEPTSSIKNALDVGCAVGRSSFVLAELADLVLGVDYSSSFIDAAKAISESGELNYEYHEEADRWKKGKAIIDRIPDNLQFEVGDACNLREDLGSFDLVHAANLLCRLPEPQAFLARLTELVSPGGQLLLTTPFTWLEEFTPREHWLGEGDSASALKNILQESFDLEVEKNLPFLIREHRRKFQYTVALGMRWRRKVTR
jgi:putative 4-mercaptohistidine N1-methyltranferase